MIPKWISIFLFLVSFYLLAQQFRRGFSKRNLLNIRYAMMIGAVALALLSDFWSPSSPLVSILFLVLSIIWLIAGIQLWRSMPPVPPRPARF